MSEGIAALEKYGPPPFDKNSWGDCVLRSSDGIHFKSWRNILSLTSPIFRDMFEIPQGEVPSLGSDIPIIDLSESGGVLCAMLALIYPIEKPRNWSFDLALGTVTAFDKYLIGAHLLQPIDNLFSDDAIQCDPEKAYALAFRLRRKTESEHASRYLHSIDLEDGTFKNLLIQRAGAEALLALWSLRYRREAAMEAVTDAVCLHNYCSAPCARRSREMVRRRARVALSLPFPRQQKPQVFFSAEALFESPSVFWFADSRVCGRCRGYFDSENTAARLAAVEKVIEEYPQTIIWPAGLIT